MSGSSRRVFLRNAALAGAALTAGSLVEGGLFAASAQGDGGEAIGHGSGAAMEEAGAQVRRGGTSNVTLSWLGDDLPQMPTGVSWGVPWPKGAVARGAKFSLSAQGRELPVQSWPLASWPDGSLKWSGFATVVPAGLNSQVTLTASGSAGSAAAVNADAGLGALVVTSDAKSICIDTGAMQCSIPLAGGANLVDSMTVEGRAVVGAGQLVCILQNGAEIAAGDVPARERFVSLIKKVTVEQSGPVRAVVKFEGVHKGAKSGREWLPFHVRLYFYAGQTPVRMVHTIFFDGDQEKDFIRGLGVSFSVPMREETHNRHVRLSGEGDGLWSEPIQPLIGRGGGSRIVNDPNGNDAYPTQLNGQRVANRAQMSKQGRDMVDHWAVWDEFKLVQLSPNGFTIQKRTNAQSSWLNAATGKRSTGHVFVGDVSGGLGVSVKNFWQSYPAELAVQNAASPAAQLTAWLWSPEAEAMDLRHYDTRAHGLQEAYEDVQAGNSTPFGIARTSELTLWPSSRVPSRPATASMAKAGTALPLLVASPQYYHNVRAFGFWSVRDTSTPFRASVERSLDATLNLYLGQVDQRSWYGFWNFGDVMHSFDEARHVWRYDLGGMAWDNSELGTDTWLWTSFLRSGRADLFRMAEAMTRHTGEVDSYHFGPMAGLGTRHGVSHWGDGAKEARIGQAAFRRFYYYLSSDERTGDVMHEATQAERSIIAYDPMREADPPRGSDKQFPARVRSGPDWLAIAGNWMTEWERTGDTQWRDKILAGMKSMEAMPHGFRTGKEMLMGFDPATGKLTARDNSQGTYNLATIMGGAELMFEMNMSIDDMAWKKIWAEFCADSGAGISLGKLQAYAYAVTKDGALARSAIDGLYRVGGVRAAHVDPPYALISSDDGTSTNNAAQSGLTAIAVLEFCADLLPTAGSAGWDAGQPSAEGSGGE